MQKSEELRKNIIHAVLDINPKFVRVIDWEGKSLPFLLAEEIPAEEKPTLVRNTTKKP